MPKPKTTTPIIRRVTVAAAGHHGGAWKVAYADFVTAMMAFFLLMWLLNATTEKQRAGLADYFNPTVVQERSGGAAAFDGVETPGTPTPADTSRGFDELARDITTKLSGEGAESMQQRNLLRHVVTRLTDEGLVIELGDLADAPLFAEETATPTPALRELSVIVARVLAHVRNEIAFTGHVRAYPEALIRSPAWELSDARAHAVRRLVEEGGLGHRRTQRVTAFGDRKARAGNPMDPVNNRIELIVLR
ncbi:chemotaxis protein MotB [Paracoccus sp. S-4012]|uniref:flagellar motor protein MotB n=1 Tax=Paracoccus sp. S-4012 TaxID=2665648 RepID=UPI0012B00C4F|nr:flagellar motor protein MotB [Paracoccus sp. S-4012]MRX49809.1 chemotaxis protein MotB [Paracoccus sp. S-4012]